MNENFLRFEDSVLEILLRGDDPVLAALRNQVALGKRTDRSFSGVGFFTKFDIPENLTLPEQPSFTISDVWGKLSDDDNVAGFVLFVKSGLIDVLEGSACEEAWPDRLHDYELFYTNGVNRDFAALAASPHWPPLD